MSNPTTSLSQQTPHTLDLTLENVPRAVLALAIPAVAENLLVTMVYLVNTLLIGRLKDPAALAAVSLGGLFLNVADQLFSRIALASSALVAHAWGAKDYGRARKTAGQSILVAVVCAAVATVLLYPAASHLLRLMGASERAVAMGSSYMQIILLTSVLGFPMVVLNGIMRGAGDTRTPMVITLLTNVWNVLVAGALVFGLGPVPALGLDGAAIGTGSARMLGGLLSLALVLAGRRFVRVRLHDVLRWDRELLGKIARLSLPMAGEALVMRMGFVLFMRTVSALGEVALAAHQIAVNVESLSFMPGHGLSVASTTLVGQSLGADRADLAESSTRAAMRFSLVVMGTLAVAFAVFGPSLAALFGSTPEVLQLAGSAVRIGALEQLPIAVLMVLSGSMRGAGDTKTPVYATLLGALLVRVPIVYLFAIVFGWGLDGVWLATAVDWTARAAVIYYLFRRGAWKTIRL